MILVKNLIVKFISIIKITKLLKPRTMIVHVKNDVIKVNIIGLHVINSIKAKK